MSGSWPAQPAPPPLSGLSPLLELLACSHEGARPLQVPAPSSAACAKGSAFVSYQASPASTAPGTDLMSALSFWLELHQIAQAGVKNAMAQVAAAYPSLAGGLAALAPAQSPAASAALQLLTCMQSRNLGQQPLSVGHSDVSATTAALAAAAGRPTTASPAGMAPLPDTLLAAAGLLTGGSGGGAAAARGGSAGAAAPDSQGAGAGGRDWSVDPGASDGSQEPQRKRPRTEGGTQPTSHRAGKVCSNCHTSNTPFWRKDRHTGLPLCNACGLYAAKNDHHRPVKLWREGQAGSPTQPPRQQQAVPQPQQQARPQPPAPSAQQPPQPQPPAPSTQQPPQPQPPAPSTQQPPQPQPPAPSTQQQLRSVAPVQPHVAQAPGPAQGQEQEAPRPASPRAIAVAAAMQAVMRQAAAAQQLQQRQQQQQHPGSGSGSPQHCGLPTAQPQPPASSAAQPQAVHDEPRGSGSGSPSVPDPAGPPSPPAAAGEAAARSPPQVALEQDGVKQRPSPHRQAAASPLAATMGVLAQS